MEAEPLTQFTRFAWDGLQIGGVRTTVKHAIGPEGQERVRRMSRLRWITKYRLARSFDSDIGFARRLSYVLLDPELESYSFDLDNEREAVAELAVARERPEDELAGYAAETHRDPELNELLTRRVRWRFDMKQRMPLGSRLAWYVSVRALKPELVVETGIHLGLGSLALLRALERNEQEGHPGELMSFDMNPDAGRLVRDELRTSWSRIAGRTSETLAPALEGRRVGMLFQDTLHTEENQRVEFGAALAHAAPLLLLVDCSGGYAPTLERLCAEHGGAYHRVALRSRAHVHPGGDFRFGVFVDAEHDGDER
jgi:hypothetical protein